MEEYVKKSEVYEKIDFTLKLIETFEICKASPEAQKRLRQFTSMVVRLLEIDMGQLKTIKH